MIGDVLQPTHLIFILVVALLVLGPKRLPEVGRSLGKGIRDFKGALSGDLDSSHDDYQSGTSSESGLASATPVTPATTAVTSDQDEQTAEGFPFPPVAPTPASASEAAEEVTPGPETEPAAEATPEPVAPAPDSSSHRA